MKTMLVIAALSALAFPDITPESAEWSEEKSDRIDSTVFVASRAGVKTPVSYSSLDREQLRNMNPMASLPMSLGLQPSVVSFNEGGTGLGYSRMSVRGVKGSQINVTLNGVTINDAESQEVFWVNMPALTNLLSSVQLQRGLGTSASGSGAFGASVNMSTASISRSPYASVDLSAGSYGTAQVCAAAGSGRLPKGFYLDLAYSFGRTDGYIRNAKALLNSAFGVLGWESGSNSLRLTYLMGDQHTGITWEGISLEQYALDRRYNPAGEYVDSEGNVRYYDNETDNYRQHRLQLNYVHSFGRLNWSSTFDYTRGDGYYEQLRSLGVRLKNMANNCYVLNSDLKYSTASLSLVGGVSLSFYDGLHFGSGEYYGDDPYRNRAFKADASVYARAEWTPLKWLTAYADLQGRFISLEMEGPDDEKVDLGYRTFWPFFNPRAGLSAHWNARHKAYASAALGHREPGRSDLKEVIISRHLGSGTEDIRPEKMVDVEIGYSYTAPKLEAGVTAYFMGYWDMLLETGKITDVGYMVKENVPRSWRRGVELTARWKPLKWLSASACASLSDNRLSSGRPILMSPWTVASAKLLFTPFRTLSIFVDAMYVGKQYLDNSGNEEWTVPGYYVCNAGASYTFDLGKGGRLGLAAYVNNFTNNLYYADGWCSDGYVGVYPQAPANYMFKLSYRF